MRFRALCAVAVLSLLIPQGCSLLPDDGSDAVNLGDCTGGPVTLSIPATVFCDVARITGTLSGPNMATRDFAIDQNNPSLSLAIPSGPDRRLVVRLFTVDNLSSPAYTSSPYTFCVSDGEPVSVSVNISKQNRNPDVGAISGAPAGDLIPGTPVALSVTVADPDACDGVKGIVWSATSGSISGSGASALWNPQCPSWKRCEATVTVAVQDGRGGTTTVHATYPIDRLD